MLLKIQQKSAVWLQQKRKPDTGEDIQFLLVDKGPKHFIPGSFEKIMNTHSEKSVALMKKNDIIFYIEEKDTWCSAGRLFHAGSGFSREEITYAYVS